MADLRVHLETSLHCNNRCVFCMEGDHRRTGYPSQYPEFLSRRKMEDLLAGVPRGVPVLFTSGEPALHPRLEGLVSRARGLGFERICLQTNGRMFCYPGLCRRLVAAGVREITVSLHGSCRRFHEAMTRLPAASSRLSPACARRWLSRPNTGTCA
jgi:molybdenum cofactor biosynthesis enzyme MoaA